MPTELRNHETVERTEVERTSSTVDLSIVVPAYAEEARLGRSLDAIAAWARGAGRRIEVIVVDDGSPDRTADVARSRRDAFPRLFVLAHEANRGKGAAVRTGALRARGEIVLVTDADLSTSIEHADALIGAIADGADVAVGSRHAPGARIAVAQPWKRRIAGRAFRALVRVLFALDVADTQCGFKAFRRDTARAVAVRSAVDRFAFDVEWLAIARRLGKKIVECPIRWEDDARSTVSLKRASREMLLDLFRIRRRLMRPWILDRSLE